MSVARDEGKVRFWMCLGIGLGLLFLQGCKDPSPSKPFSFAADRVIAEVKTGHENGGIGLAAADHDGDGEAFGRWSGCFVQK